MKKQKFDLTSEIIKLDENAEETQPITETTMANKVEKVMGKKKVLITMAVEEELRKKYKMWCTRRGFKMAEAFIKGFELLKKEEFR